MTENTITVEAPDGTTTEITEQDVVLAVVASRFANGHGPGELSDDAKALVLEAVEVYAEALEIGQVALFLHGQGAPTEIIEAISASGLELMNRFDVLKGRFDTEFPEYAVAEDDTEED